MGGGVVDSRSTAAQALPVLAQHHHLHSRLVWSASRSEWLSRTIRKPRGSAQRWTRKGLYPRAEAEDLRRESPAQRRKTTRRRHGAATRAAEEESPRRQTAAERSSGGPHHSEEAG